MLTILAFLFWLAQAGANPIPATDVSAADIQATLRQEIANSVTDMQIRTVDAGGHHVGIGLVHRPTGFKGFAVAVVRHPQPCGVLGHRL